MSDKGKDETYFIQRNSIPNADGKLIVTAISKKGILFHDLVTPKKDCYGRYIIPQSELKKLEAVK